MRAALAGLFIAVFLLACTSQSAFADEPAVLDASAVDAALVADDESSGVETSVGLSASDGLSEGGESALDSEVPEGSEDIEGPAAPEEPSVPEDPEGLGGLAGVEDSDSAAPTECGGGAACGGIGYFGSITPPYGEVVFKEAQPEELAAGEKVQAEDDRVNAPEQKPRHEDDEPATSTGGKKASPAKKAKKVRHAGYGAFAASCQESAGVSPASCGPTVPVSDLAILAARCSNLRVASVGLVPEESSVRTAQSSPDSQCVFLADSGDVRAAMLAGAVLHAGDAAALAREGDPVRCRSPSFA